MVFSEHFLLYSIPFSLSLTVLGWSECLHVTSVTPNVKLHFAPLATGPNFGSRDFIGSLRGQSEMTLNGMSSDTHNGMNSLDLILITATETTVKNLKIRTPEKTAVITLKVEQDGFSLE